MRVTREKREENLLAVIEKGKKIAAEQEKLETVR